MSEPEGAGESEGAFELERVEHETSVVFGPEGATLEELKPEKSFLPEPDCYGRKSSALNSPQRGPSNVRSTHGCSGAYSRESRRHHRGIRRRPAGGE